MSEPFDESQLPPWMARTQDEIDYRAAVASGDPLRLAAVRLRLKVREESYLLHLADGDPVRPIEFVDYRVFENATIESFRVNADRIWDEQGANSQQRMHNMKRRAEGKIPDDPRAKQEYARVWEHHRKDHERMLKRIKDEKGE